jgi:hypothetical protein
MVREGGCHSLYDVIYRIQSGIDDRPAQRFEARNVEGDTVIDDENLARAMVPRIADIREYAVEGIRVEIAATHFDDRAKAAIDVSAPIWHANHRLRHVLKRIRHRKEEDLHFRLASG